MPVIHAETQSLTNFFQLDSNDSMNNNTQTSNEILEDIKDNQVNFYSSNFDKNEPLLFSDCILWPEMTNM